MTTTPVGIPGQCGSCRTELAPGLLRCPACRALVHADRLKEIAGDAKAAETAGDHPRAAEAWHAALALLPEDAPQRAGIISRLAALDGKSGNQPHHRPTSQARTGGILAAAGSVVLLLLTKAKLLLLGLTKLSTLLSMLAFFGLYWGVWGWKFAAGFALSIYVHEMGHVLALKRYGIPASPPMFIPGFGAIVRLKAHPPTASQDAQVGLAGPLWGSVAALVAWLVYLGTRSQIWGALAHVGAVINLFNLTPVWQLDGARGIRPLSRAERIGLLLMTLACFAVVHEGFLVLIAIFLGLHCLGKLPEQGDRRAFHLFAVLLLGLTALASVRVL